MGRRKLTTQQKMIVPAICVVSIIVYIFVLLLPTVAYHNGEEKEAFVTDYEVVSRGLHSTTMWYELQVDGKKYEVKTESLGLFQGDTVRVVKMGDKVTTQTKADMLRGAYGIMALCLVLLLPIAHYLYPKKLFFRRILPLVSVLSLSLFGAIAYVLYG